MMAFRISSVVVVALVMACSAAAQEEALFPICHITSDVDPKTFETLYVPATEILTYEDAGDLEGPCNDYLGQLCDDDLMCTIDFDYDLVQCLPEPRETVPTCTETA